MKNTTKGFTLIELLVVVLIIGILSSIALPQYQKAVEKIRVAEVMTYADAWIKAQQLYKMANGSFSNDLTNLDISLPELKYFSKINTGARDMAQIYFTPKDNSSFYGMYRLAARLRFGVGDDKFTLERVCISKDAAVGGKGVAICQAISNSTTKCPVSLSDRYAPWCWCGNNG